MLFDLDADPGEQHDLFAKGGDVADALGAELDRWTAEQLAGDQGAAEREVDADGLRELRAMGYVGAGH